MQELSWQDLRGGTDGDDNSSPTPGAGTDRPKRTRRPRGTTGDVALTKGAIVEAISLANFPIQLSGYGRYALSAAEIDQLADAWFKVIKQNPYIAKYLVQAGKLGVWGNLLLVHAKIIGARLEMYSREQDALKRSASAPQSTSARADGKPMRSELLS